MELPAADSGKWPALIKHAASARIGTPTPAPSSDNRYLCTGARSQKQRWLQPHEVDEMVLAYKSGQTVYEIAKVFKCHRTTVSGHMKARGVLMRIASMTEAKIDQAVELYGSGLSLAKVGKQLGFDAETIRQSLISRGIALRGSHERHIPTRAIQDIEQ